MIHQVVVRSNGYTVETGYKIPKIQRKPAKPRQNKWFFLQIMMINESFKLNSMKEVQSASTAAKRLHPKKFSYRKIDSTYRMWRVK